MVLPHDFHPLHMNQDSWLVPSKKGNIGCKLQIEMEDTEMIYYTYYIIDFILCR